MSIKGEWIDQFVEKLMDYDEVFLKNGNYAYQLATAYFDWSIDEGPEYTVEEAFNRYLNHEAYA